MPMWILGAHTLTPMQLGKVCSESEDDLRASDYQAWMRMAFLQVEAALAAEFLTPSRAVMTEEYVRAALMKGLMLSRPTHAARVFREFTAGWDSRSCYASTSHVRAKGRAIQHDVGVSSHDGDAGMICEVKWLTGAKSSEIAADIWKLALTRSTMREGAATRTYLLLGGESKPFSAALSSLRKVGLDLRWSKAGRTAKASRGTTLLLGPSLQHALAFNAWRRLVSWGKSPTHYRRAPDAWWHLKATSRETWFRTLAGVEETAETVSWRIVLWELHHWGVHSQDQVDWASVYSNIKFDC